MKPNKYRSCGKNNLLICDIMGTAASIESVKPADASDIIDAGFFVAKNEIIRLRNELGHLAVTGGFGVVVMDASDICLGVNEDEDFERCVKEIIHIRSALRLSTQTSRRKTRVAVNVFDFGSTLEKNTLDQDNDSTSDSSTDDDHDQNDYDDTTTNTTSNTTTNNIINGNNK